MDYYFWRGGGRLGNFLEHEFFPHLQWAIILLTSEKDGRKHLLHVFPLAYTAVLALQEFFSWKLHNGCS